MDFKKLIFLKIKNNILSYRTKISSLNNIIFFRQLATLISSNIPIIQSIEMLYQTQNNPLLKSILLKLKYSVEEGNYLSSSLRKFPRYFDDLTCHLLAIGEHSGTFELMLQQLANHKEKTYHFHNKIKRSLFYPAVISIVALVVCLIMLLVIVPRFSQLFQEMHVPLPSFTLAVIHISENLQHYGFLFVFPLSLCILLAKNNIRSTQVAHKLQLTMLKLPIIGPITKNILITNFTRYLSITLKAGLPISEAMQLIAKASGNISFEKELLLLKQNIEKGNKIHNAMRNSSHFPNLLVEMVKIGEESGTLDHMLEKISILYENELDQLTTYLSDLLEPLIMVILGVLIGGLVIAMYLPIFKLGTVL